MGFQARAIAAGIIATFLTLAISTGAAASISIEKDAARTRGGSQIAAKHVWGKTEYPRCSVH